MSKRRHLEELPIITAATGGDDAGSASTDDRVAALCKDIERFSHNKKIPQGLDLLVDAREETQALWYLELAVKWQESPPTTAEDATLFVCQSLEKAHEPYGVKVSDLEGFLYFYKLPHYHHLDKKDTSGLTSLPGPPPRAAPQFEKNDPDFSSDAHKLMWRGDLGNTSVLQWITPSFAEDAPHFSLDTRKRMSHGDLDNAPIFRLRTLPVTRDKVTDGGAFTVFVEVKKFYLVPLDMLCAISKRHRAVINGDDGLGSKLLKEINAMGDYEIMDFEHVEILTRKYLIKLRGIAVPEVGTPHGIDARDELAKTVDGKCLTIEVYYLDECMRCVGDVYYNGTLLQDMLGPAWHYTCTLAVTNVGG